jgi:hypothetical protein
MRLAIADPPYPPLVGSGGVKARASRWYGDGQRSLTDRPSDRHDNAADWDAAATHRGLLDRLVDEYDGWAIATSPDGIAAYGPLPVGCRIMAWVKPNAQPGAHRIGSYWEAVIVFPPFGRRSNRNGSGMTRDVLTAPVPGGFVGAKPTAWTHWVLDALTFDPDSDSVDDLFPGSGSVTKAIAIRQEVLGV